ncbi:cation diffusion facilitator family transporter [Neobacillus dielmonensis]|uniref:cation diffusion facilitator family transporter n=1 Tax=Neobacillus dielmonensis TaxID=1347369 RepID=UPI0005A91570|nr:cation diffusion facilitator family transporter [Neobacillus dielmonensis]
MDQEKYLSLRKGEKGVIISIAVYLFLAALKIIVGYLANSEALKADGLNNTTDIVSSLVVFIGLRVSQRPADDDHPYGHWKAETVASMVSSFIMMAVGIGVLFEAVSTVVKGKETSPDPISAITGLLCAVVMYLVYRYNRTLAKKTSSQAVMAAAKDNLSDAWVSIGTTLGILGAQLNLPWLDPVTAVVVGLLICHTAWDIFRDSSHRLTDGFDVNEIDAFKVTVQGISGVKGIKDLKARNYGSSAVVDIVILVNSNLNVRDAHDVADKVETELRKEHDVFDVNVHVEPN